MACCGWPGLGSAWLWLKPRLGSADLGRSSQIRRLKTKGEREGVAHRGSSSERKARGGRRSAVEASRRFQGSWDTGKAPGRAARRGEHAGGRRACRRAPERRCEVAAVAPSSGEAQMRAVRTLLRTKGPRNYQKHSCEHGERRGAKRKQWGGPLWPETMKTAGGTELLRRAISRAWRRDSARKRRAMVAVVTGFIALVAGQLGMALMASNRGRDPRV